MFELLFKYPLAVFSRGRFILAAPWPVWVLVALVAALGLMVGFLTWRRRGGSLGIRSLGIWALQSAAIALLLLLLWQPALSISTLKPQQNVVAVVIDDSRSMATREGGAVRIEQALQAINSSFINNLKARFQVRLYHLSSQAERLEKLDRVTAQGGATHIGESLKQLTAESSLLPLGAIVLASDGGDNSGGIDAETIAEIRRRRIPVHTVGFGREGLDKDVEISDVQVPARTLADARLAAVVSFRQQGFTGRKAKLTVKDAGKLLASREITYKADNTQQTETITFNSGIAGAKNLQVSLETMEGEANPRNNSLTRVVSVEPAKPRVLYIEGEPKWEFKFIRRAVEEDRNLELDTILRTTQNKIFRQGFADSKELEMGFPAKVEELFNFQGLILGGVEANYFTPAQQELVKQFVDRRGGGLLFLGGRAGLAEGGYRNSPLAELLPVEVPDRKTTFFRDPATVELTQAGRESLICRLEEDPDRNVARWKKLPYLANFQEVSAPKPGAVVLAEFLASGRGRFPLLVTENYGRGRTALFATAGSWRWQMLQALEDKTHERFWQQLLRWLVSDTRGRVVASTPHSVVYDDARMPVQASVKDTNYLPASDASVEAHILGPEGLSASVELEPDPLEAGDYTLNWTAPQPGSYLVEVVARRGQEEAGRDVFTFRREDGVAEDFHVEQNRELLEKLAEETGGRYWRPADLNRLANEIQYSEAGISTRETKDLWNMPVVFLALLALRGAEWLLRRKWGAV